MSRNYQEGEIFEEDGLLWKIVTMRPVGRYSKAAFDSTRHEPFCAICLKLQKDTIISELICSHNFHYECLQEWSRQKNTCPICRRNVV